MRAGNAALESELFLTVNAALESELFLTVKPSCKKK
jgi:hypothetical protein